MSRRCVEAPHQLSPDALSKPTPATKMRLSSSDYDAYARLVGARPEAFDLIASTSRSPEGARNPKPKITAECIETELKASAEKCIVPTFHGRDVESQIVTSWAFPVKEQSAIRANVGMDIENGAVPTFDDTIFGFYSPIHSQNNEYVASITPPSHGRTLSVWELEDPIPAEDWLEIATGRWDTVPRREEPGLYAGGPHGWSREITLGRSGE